jgi:hypothetical protein
MAGLNVRRDRRGDDELARMRPVAVLPQGHPNRSSMKKCSCQKARKKMFWRGSIIGVPVAEPMRMWAVLCQLSMEVELDRRRDKKRRSAWRMDVPARTGHPAL